MNKKRNNKKKNPSVELMRIIGAMMVVGTHIKLSHMIDSHISKTSVAISCLVGDGVSIFWMIVGFYLFDNTDYLKHIKKTISRIIIPMVCYTILLFYFRDFLVSPSSNVITRHNLTDYKNLIIHGFIKLRNTVSDCGQFWYLYSYIVVILFFPALLGIVQYKAHNKRRDIILISIIGLLLLINDLTLNEFINFSHAPFQGAFGAAFIIVFGHILYKYKANFQDKYNATILSIVAFIIIFCMRFIVQYKLYQSEKPSNHPLYWYTLFSIATISCIAIFSFSLNKQLAKRIPCAIINHLGGLTMGIYFVHPLIISILRERGIIQSLTEKYSKSSMGIIMYQIILMGLVIILSALTTEVFNTIKSIIYKLTHKNITEEK